MAITPVNTSTDAATQAVQQPKKNIQTPQPPASNQANSASKLHQQPSNVAKQVQAHSTTQAPKPVPNGQGQTTGKIVNATA